MSGTLRAKFALYKHVLQILLVKLRNISYPTNFLYDFHVFLAKYAYLLI